MMRVILCEDDVNHMKLNKEYIENTIKMQGKKFEIRTYCAAEDIMDSDIEWANVAFLDIDLGYGKQNGIALAQKAMKVNKLLAIIFITCYQEYTKEAFKLQAFGYLEKPIVRNELLCLVERLAKYVEADDTAQFLEVYDNRKQTVVRGEDIIYAEKIGRKVTLYTMGDDISVTESILALEGKLGKAFVKINQGILVNKRYVSKLERDIIYMTTGERLKISRNRLKIVSGQLAI